MAELNTRLQLKIDRFDKWNKWYSSVDGAEVATPNFKAEGFSFDAYANKGAALLLKKGEVALCEITDKSQGAQTAPTVLFKVGDGKNRFCNLNWASALAADVYEWAKKSEADFLEWLKTENKFLVDSDLTDINTKLLGLDMPTENGEQQTVMQAIDDAKTELKGQSGDTDASETIAGAKKYADKIVNELLKAYITSDGGAIDKLQEIAAWIDSDKNGVADIIATLEGKLDKTAFDTFKTGDFKEVADKAHEHSNFTLLETYTQTEADLADAVAKKHEHADKAVDVTQEEKNSWNGKLDSSAFETFKTTSFDPVANKAHEHTSSIEDIEDAVAKKHSHTYTATDAEIQAAVDAKHTHANGSVDVSQEEKDSWNDKLDSSDFETFKTTEFDPVADKAHTHTYTATDAQIQEAVNAKHTHTYTATDDQIQEAVDAKHTHIAGAVDVTQEEKDAWNGKLDANTYEAEKVNFIKNGDTLVINCGSSTEVI